MGIPTTYSVTKSPAGFFTAWKTTEDANSYLGDRPKYKTAQRLCEQTAGRELNWKSLGRGNYEGK